MQALQCNLPCSLEAVSTFGAWAAALQKGTALWSESLLARRAVDLARVTYMLLQLRSPKPALTSPGCCWVSVTDLALGLSEALQRVPIEL